MGEQDSSSTGALAKALIRAQWEIRKRLHAVDGLTASLYVVMRRLTLLEAEERRLLALLERAPAFELLQCGPWCDVSTRRAGRPAWWPELPEGWRLTGKQCLTLEHRDGRRLDFEDGDALVAFARRMTAPELPGPARLQRVRPRARRARAAGDGGGDA